MPVSNECLSRDDVGTQVSNNQLQWKSGSAPTLGAWGVSKRK